MTRRLNPGAAAGASRPDLDWQESAACRGLGDLFFGPEVERLPDQERREAQARTICSGCPVLAECDRYAAGSGQRWGIWAGVDRERVLPVAPEPPVPCSKGLHLMTPENSKPLPGTTRAQCRACLRESDRRTGPARHARNAETRNARDRARYAEQKKQQAEEKVA